jgi:hypothetical protein
MSDADRLVLPPQADKQSSELEALIQRVIQRTLAQLGPFEATPFVNSKACAELIGVSPEHLCAMRARGQGPPWSGDGKWIRYERRTVVEWIRNLPTTTTAQPEPHPHGAGPL